MAIMKAISLAINYWKPVAVILLFLGVGAGIYYSGFHASEREWTGKWHERDLAELRARAQQEGAERSKEFARQTIIGQVNENASKQLEQAHAETANAKSSVEQLQHTISKLRQQLIAGHARQNAPAAGKCQTEARSSLLLAQLLEESVERNRALANYADQSAIRGAACERIWDKIVEQTP
ncbi:DUF2514 family protein [Erwinia tasmaniensis]|uniref:DUF2514 family protein n=1 Tax=Erwinia tasmaniensis TaxID=338565 RepID=UPI003A4D67A0